MTSAKIPSAAFAFDIDGVLVKGKQPVPGARETIQLLQDLGVPFIFLTNGGGHTEAAHVAKLGERLNLSLHPKQFVQSHTPFLDLVPQYGNETVLALGGSGQQIRNLAHAYGFKKVVTSSDFVVQYPHLHPFPEMTKDHHAEHGDHNIDLRKTKISAILVWTSPRDWCLDQQLITDLLLSDNGIIGTKSPTNGDATLPNHGYQRNGQPKLFFCNPDFEWATSHDQPRFAQGAFRRGLEGIWDAATQGRARLEYTLLGKPTKATYEYGERVLREYGDMLGRSISTVYMVGDNTESDIVGANSFRSRAGIAWKSVLVETGVYEAGSAPRHTPAWIAADVRGAVDWALAREGEADKETCGVV